MKKYDGRYAIWWMWIVAALCLAWGCGSVYAGGYAYTQEGFEGGVSFQHSDGSSCDSARFFFGYDGAGVNSDNLYTSIKLTPINSDSSTLEGTGLDLDSTGMHIVEIYFWLAGSSDSTGLVASWLHLPAAEALLGTGSDSIVIYAIDSTGTPAAVQDVKITVRNAVGTKVIVAYTGSSGSVTVWLDAGTYTFSGRKTGYGWVSRPYTVAGDDDSTALNGFDIVLTSPSAANTCNVYGFLEDGQGLPIVGAVVTAERTGGVHGIDTSSTTVMVPPILIRSRPSDTTGLFEIFLRKTGSYADTTKGFYNIIGTYGDEIFNINKFYVPDQDSVNLGDTILGRGL